MRRRGQIGFLTLGHSNMVQFLSFLVVWLKLKLKMGFRLSLASLTKSGGMTFIMGWLTNCMAVLVQLMLLLVLPSQRMLMWGAKGGKASLLGLKCEDYTICGALLISHHYKTVRIHRLEDLREPILQETYLKKVQASQMRVSSLAESGRPVYQCIISDKFGDMHQITLEPKPDQPEQFQITKSYMNSNLGIPKYLRDFQLLRDAQIHRYFLLSDEESRIKVYNGARVHELLTVWHMLDRHSVDLLTFPLGGPTHEEILVILIKFFNKTTLEEGVDVHWLNKSELEMEEYPGRVISRNLHFDKHHCKYFSMLKCGPSHLVLFFLHQECIKYEVFKRNQQGHPEAFSSLKVHEIPIAQGNWDYLHAVFREEGAQVLMAYGTQVDNPIDLEGGGPDSSWDCSTCNNVNLNKYENLVLLTLDL